jgi:HPt (histidine-containing phosphotransfer) domain-containing protein
MPIVAMTALAMKDDKERCLEAGMDGYIAKPIRTPQLMEVLDDIARKLSPGDTPAPAPAEVRKEGSGGEQCPDQEANAVFNAREALAQCLDSKDLLQNMITIFLQTHQRMMQDIRSALERGNATGVQHSAHALKGAVGSLVATRAYESALALEKIGKTGELTNAQPAFETLVRHVDELTARLAMHAGLDELTGVTKEEA